MALTKQISSRALVLSPTTAEVSTAQTIAPYYDFRLDGVLDIPVSTTFDSARYVDAQQTLIFARLSVLTGGTAQYRVIVNSYDATGAFQTQHINTVVSPTTNNAIYTLAFIDQVIPANSTLVMSVGQEVAGTFAEDLSLTLVSGTFADINQINPQNVAGIHPIGGIYKAGITVAQFQAQMGTIWIEANGQSSVGTAYQTLTGNAVVPTLSPDVDGLTVMIRVN